ncbi:pyridoxine 5'-phosphate synthase [Aeoliella mucimassa]|uniref:Pyridoxine 5'-phosphate synthase n=1 Tax=Aeoliella mucimassa TaxID=2527972 RepID=A0A518AKB8_9BACT|nr:pyridoxine 5'-phosphate synthase [Aeoliella mucimassa]QDU55136.1 Pyridoxine 5'-phosphate synthase [Aeoliella mucimassa]
MARLGVNIDHVATVRQARKTNEPDPVWAAALAELGGADGITLHLREDRRHIQDRDARLLVQTVAVPTNLECATTDEMLQIACELRPSQVTLVPERREEVTTEGGLDVIGQQAKVGEAVKRLQDAGIVVSLFLDPDPRQLEAGIATGAEAIELHTGAYAHASDHGNAEGELKTLTEAGRQITDGGLILNAGHGLTYRNVRPVAAIANMHELNIGHSIMARAMMVGMEQAVRDMKRLVAGCDA